MWIRSQDGDRLVNLTGIVDITGPEIDDFVKPIRFNDRWTIWVDGHGVAAYSTEEKAMKVLDMIQDKIYEFLSLDMYHTHILQMPKDEEVV